MRLEAYYLIFAQSFSRIIARNKLIRLNSSHIHFQLIRSFPFSIFIWFFLRRNLTCKLESKRNILARTSSKSIFHSLARLQFIQLFSIFPLRFYEMHNIYNFFEIFFFHFFVCWSKHPPKTHRHISQMRSNKMHVFLSHIDLNWSEFLCISR